MSAEPSPSPCYRDRMRYRLLPALLAPLLAACAATTAQTCAAGKLAATIGCMLLGIIPTVGGSLAALCETDAAAIEADVVATMPTVAAASAPRHAWATGLTDAAGRPIVLSCAEAGASAAPVRLAIPGRSGDEMACPEVAAAIRASVGRVAAKRATMGAR